MTVFCFFVFAFQIALSETADQVSGSATTFIVLISAAANTCSPLLHTSHAPAISPEENGVPFRSRFLRFRR